MYSSKYFDHLVVFTAGIGMFLSTLDSGIINVALPTLSKSFNVTPSFITWSVTLLDNVHGTFTIESEAKSVLLGAMQTIGQVQHKQMAIL